tara:strand:- start:292 stop:603 length:312 start_codon:yes stop_codon:yes gene_type:complete
MARPKKHKIDTKQIMQLASYGCTNREIASFFDCSESLLKKSYSSFLTKGREKGKIRLRQMQWKSAEKGNVTMQIWLGKQMLGQSEQPMVMENELVEGFDLEIL